jgi:NAD(P)-dependent dehydrogenase (short-subunit alcohol dehydrogenase family)
MHNAMAGRHALVTGASRGIGREIAILFAEQGSDVALVGRDAETLGEVAAQVAARGRSAVVITADVVAPDAPERIVAEALAGLGSLDVLVNNAGGNSFSVPVRDMRMSGWDKVLNLNLGAVVRLIHAALPALTASGNAAIVNVSSVAGVRAAPTMAHYGAAKAGLINLTQTLAVEVAGDGIRVNALVPGWIQTDLTDFLRVDDATEALALARVPMARWGRVDEIAQGALFLASDASSFMTGQSLVLDGGLTAHL